MLNLRNLHLSFNFLSNSIPEEIGARCLNLEHLDLSGNLLSGSIPYSLANCSKLRSLILFSNLLDGSMPSDFGRLKELEVLDVSQNKLSGVLPLELGNCTQLSVLILSNPYHPNRRRKAMRIRKCCTPRSSQQMLGKREVTIFADIGVPITYESVLRATGGFNASNCIGSGGFGATYKAEIHPGVVVAIKRLSIGRLQGVLQFDAEIKTLGRWRHPNLVTLIGYHLSDAEMFLIYNYFPGGNLERFIQERSKRPTDWRIFHKIAIDVARALAYLHDHCVPRILHRDVKPSNILLDKDYKAYLSDFGLARLLGNSETHATTGVAGTFGYVAPEYAMTCRVSDKADVYSYGVVLLELLSDKKALDPSFSPYGNGFNIVAWACLLLRQGRAREFFIDGLWGVAPRDDLVETLHLAVMCTVDSLPIRPTMKQVVQRLKQLQPPNY